MVEELEDVAYGGVLRDGAGRICLVRPVGRGLWALPKGHLDRGEDPAGAALREVAEETGRDPVLAPLPWAAAPEPARAAYLGEIGYTYPLRRKGRDYSVRKVVHFWAMELASEADRGHDHEMEAARFFEPEEALEKMGYPTEQELLRRALAGPLGAAVAGNAVGGTEGR